jgi:ribonuclease VapC
MIVVDSSALIAILENEPDARIYAVAIREANRLLISAVMSMKQGLLFMPAMERSQSRECGVFCK